MAQNNLYIKELLENIDVLVDGKFDEDKKSYNLFFKGSSNQRVLDLPESLKQSKPVELQKFANEREFKQYNRFNHTRKGVYI